VVVKPWPFGFRVTGHLKVDVGAGDPPAVEFVNRTDFEVQFHFATPFLSDPNGAPLGQLTILARGAPERRDLLRDAEGWYQYEARVMVNLGGVKYVEASGGSRPDIDIQR
jgi:hypothetical protein